MKISYTILSHNEVDSLKNLLEILFEKKSKDDEVVVVDDYSEKKTREILYYYSKRNDFRYLQRELNNDFAEQHNYANSLSRGDYIFSIDADEYPNEFLIENVHEILGSNDIDLIWVPRINTVEGITQEHLIKWRWRINDKGWINFPDYQTRIYKNNKSIKWESNVHERVVGAKLASHFPTEEQFCLYHPKVIEKQEIQNEFYSKIRNQ
jgi:glycosyltransferase involved in cell wall biosynthesis